MSEVKIGKLMHRQLQLFPPKISSNHLHLTAVTERLTIPQQPSQVVPAVANVQRHQ